MSAMATKPATIDRVPASDHIEHADQRVLWSDRAWQDYEQLDAMRGDRAVPRLTFLDGSLELMSPSKPHENIGWLLGRLIEEYLKALGIEGEGAQSWTLKRLGSAALESDGCWILGGRDEQVRPDLALEIQWTRGGLDKLEIYHRLGVPEVWVWHDDTIDVYAWSSTGYARGDRSTLIPEVDVALLLQYLERPTTLTTVGEFAAELARRHPRA